jgi:Winged helix-turn helix
VILLNLTALGTRLKTIARVRKRFVAEDLEAAIDHRPRPTRPDKIKTKGNVEQKLIQLACAAPSVGDVTGQVA